MSFLGLFICRNALGRFALSDHELGGGNIDFRAAAPEDITPKLSSKVTKMMGVIKLPQDYDYKKELGNALAKKYKS